jgi:hypothetical protein
MGLAWYGCTEDIIIYDMGNENGNERYLPKPNQSPLCFGEDYPGQDKFLYSRANIATLATAALPCIVRLFSTLVCRGFSHVMKTGIDRENGDAGQGREG